MQITNAEVFNHLDDDRKGNPIINCLIKFIIPFREVLWFLP